MLGRFRSAYKIVTDDDYPVECKLIQERHEKHKTIATYRITCPVTFGHTIGNSIRRTILSTARGSAVVAVRIEGAKHSFDIVEGIKETVQEIVLNLKNLYVKIKHDSFAYIRISKQKSGIITAEDFEESNQVEIINKDLYICTLDKNANFEAEVMVVESTGYKQANEHIFSPELHSEFFAVDSIFSRVDCAYDVETNTGGKKNFDIITLQITTNGDITPEQALKEACNKLTKSCFAILSSETKEDFLTDKSSNRKDPIMSTLISDLHLSVRLKNCLLNNNVNTIEDLVQKTLEELMSLNGFGDACLAEVNKEVLDKYGLALSLPGLLPKPPKGE